MDIGSESGLLSSRNSFFVKKISKALQQPLINVGLKQRKNKRKKIKSLNTEIRKKNFYISYERVKNNYEFTI